MFSYEDLKNMFRMPTPLQMALEALDGGHIDRAYGYIQEALAQPEQLVLAQEVIGCFHAAEVEGLTAALDNTTDEHLKDLIERRLMYAFYAAQETQENKMNAIEQLKSVLCGPDGQCCIAGADEDRLIIDRALAALAHLVQPEQDTGLPSLKDLKRSIRHRAKTEGYPCHFCGKHFCNHGCLKD